MQAEEELTPEEIAEALAFSHALAEAANRRMPSMSLQDRNARKVRRLEAHEHGKRLTLLEGEHGVTY